MITHDTVTGAIAGANPQRFSLLTLCYRDCGSQKIIAAIHAQENIVVVEVCVNVTGIPSGVGRYEIDT